MKMSLEEKREKLMQLKKGSIIKYHKELYEVVGLSQNKEAKLLRTDIVLLKVGKERMSKVVGKFLNKGKILDVDNAIHRTWYAENAYMDLFEIVK